MKDSFPMIARCMEHQWEGLGLDIQRKIVELWDSGDIGDIGWASVMSQSIPETFIPLWSVDNLTLIGIKVG